MEFQIVLDNPLPCPNPGTLLLVSLSTIFACRHLGKTCTSTENHFALWLVFTKATVKQLQEWRAMVGLYFSLGPWCYSYSSFSFRGLFSQTKPRLIMFKLRKGEIKWEAEVRIRRINLNHNYFVKKIRCVRDTIRNKDASVKSPGGGGDSSCR